MADPSNYNGGRGEEEAEDEEEIDETGYKTIKDAVLFAIDVSKTMLTAPPDDTISKKTPQDTATVAALKCAFALMQQRIISNPNDMMGILLFGTEQSRFQEDDEHGRGFAYDHCYLLTDLAVPAASDVKRLKSLVEEGDDEEAQDVLRPAAKGTVSMANVLFCANQIFTTKAPNFSSRRLFLVTDNDAPHPDDQNARHSAAVRAKDLYDLGVVIELFPISRPDHAFDKSIFYDDIIYSATPADPDAPMPLTQAAKASTSSDGISLLQSLLSKIQTKAAQRRAIFSNLPFELAPGLRISVKGFVVVKRQEAVRSSYVYTGGEKAQIASGASTYLAEDTARVIEKVEIKKAFKFGGETILFSQEETRAIRNFGDPVLRIIGFKSLDLLPVWANIKPSVFIYPSEEEYIGSTRVFSALQQKLLRAGKFGLAWYVPRKNAVPTLAAVIASAEELDDEGLQKMSAGLWVHPLPYADDVRQPPDTQALTAKYDLIDHMRVIIQQLQLPKGVYDPHKYPNPALQWFYKILQAMALEEELPEKAEDKTVPRHRQIHKRAGQYVQEWGRLLDAQYKTWQMDNADTTDSHGPIKRGAPTSNGSKELKRPKAVSPADAPSDAEMQKHFEQDSLGKLTVAMLKAWATSKGLSVNGKKADILDSITAHFETKMNLG